MTSGSKAREERERAREQARKIASKNNRGGNSNRPLFIKLGVVIGLLAVVGLIVGIVVFGSKKSGPDFGSTTAPPANISDTGAVVFKADKPKENAPTVAIYVDFQCPACKQFEEGNDVNLKQMAKAGDIILEQHPIAILDHMSSTNYASRAANAFACVVNTAPDKAEAFSKKLFEIQPPEQTAGLPNTKLADAAKEVGVTGIDDCIRDGQNYRGWVKDVTQKAIDNGLNATPGIFINGTQWDRQGSVYDAIAKAGSAPATATPAATPAG